MRGVVVFYILVGLFSTFVANQRGDWEKRVYLRCAIASGMSNDSAVGFLYEDI